MSTGLRAGTNNDGYLQVNGTDVLTALSSGKIGIGTSTPTADIQLETSAYPTLKVQNTSNASGFPVFQLIDNRTNGVSFNIENGRDAGSLNFRDNTSTADRLTITSDGKVRLPDNGKLTLGAGDDLQIWSDNTDQYIRGEQNQLIVRSNNLKLQSYLGENYIHCAMNYDVSLFYDNSKKFETTSSGAKVTGALEVTQEYPTVRPTLDLNFAATKTLDRRITFTRDSIGTYVDENGVLKYASNNTPRFDHDIETGESLGLLIEQSSTNLFLHGENFTASYWTKNGGGNPATTVTADQAAAPDGTMTADYIDYTTATGNSQNIERQFDSSPAGKTYTASVFIKGTAGQTINLTLDGYGVNGSASQHTLNGRWQRFSITRSYPNGHTQAAIFRFGCRNLNHPSTGTATQIHAWGAQLEQIAFSTSYIPSSSTGTVTRVQDFATITGTNFTDFYNDTEGSLYSDFSLTGLDAAYNSTTVMLTNNTTTNYLAIFGHNPVIPYAITGGSVQFNATLGGSSTTGVNYRAAMAYKLNDFAASLNGGTVSTDTSATIPPADRMLIGRRVTLNKSMNGYIRAIKYYNKRLSNAQLQGLTQQ